ncbi:MAG: hypothetical protein ABSB40_11165 [Nitrososphaeria archaeon]|jgi:hypothetical protein
MERMVEPRKSYLQRFNRLLAVPTLVLFIILTISGYGITNPNTVRELTGGVFTRALSLYVHTNLILPALTLLTIHVLIVIRSTLIRWGFKEGIALNSFLILLGALTVALLVLMQYLVV